MKKLKSIFLLLVSSLSVSLVSAQANAFLNILTQNGGLVQVGGIVNIEVTVGNTGPISPINVNKVRAQISVPSALVSILPNAQQTGLPPGWTITVNTGSAITVCNGSDVIPVNQARTILIRIQGNTLGGPSTVNGNLLFSSGASCTAPGSLSGDNTADNGSTTSVQVVAVTPLKLTSLTTKLIDCESVLNWTTENEVNTSNFDIERSNSNNTNWISVGKISANINSNTRNEYSFIDKKIQTQDAQLFYRLKMIDNDGTYKYSKVVNVLNTCKIFNATVFPNPTENGRLNINVSGLKDYAEVTLISVSGQLALKTTMQNGKNYLNVANLASGKYIINIKDTNGMEKKMDVLIAN